MTNKNLIMKKKENHQILKLKIRLYPEGNGSNEMNEPMEKNEAAYSITIISCYWNILRWKNNNCQVVPELMDKKEEILIHQSIQSSSRHLAVLWDCIKGNGIMVSTVICERNICVIVGFINYELIKQAFKKMTRLFSQVHFISIKFQTISIWILKVSSFSVEWEQLLLCKNRR
jgi:hypothetical protein